MQFSLHDCVALSPIKLELQTGHNTKLDLHGCRGFPNLGCSLGNSSEVSSSLIVMSALSSARLLNRDFKLSPTSSQSFINLGLGWGDYMSNYIQNTICWSWWGHDSLVAGLANPSASISSFAKLVCTDIILLWTLSMNWIRSGST